MENIGISHGELNLDTRVLSNFIIEFNISLRLVNSHPPNHPIITASIGKVLRHLAELLEFREEITVGVARDTLMVGYALLDPKNPVYRNLARVLFDRDIAAITIHKNITSEELLRFNEIMAHKREYLRENGGIEQVVSNADIRNIVPRAVNYGYFRTTEEERMVPAERNLRKHDASAIWEHFVHGLLDGTLDPNGNHTTFANVLDPGALAEIVNGSELREESYATVIASFMGDLDNVESESRYLGDSIEKLSKFVSRLNPELRRQFLNGVFTCAGTNRNITEEMLARFPDDIILEALADINSRTSYTPPVTISLLQRLSKDATAERDGKTTSTLISEKEYEHLGQKLRIIFREEERDEFVPLAYQQTLRAITSMNGISMPELEEIEEERQTLLSHFVETQFCRVILEIMQAPSDDCPVEAMGRNLFELFEYFLETGDFSFLAGIYCHLAVDESDANHASPPHGSEILDFFTGRDFIERVLDSFNSWEKAKHPDIRALIRRMGSPFVEPLLLRLADERNISLRRSYLECLMELGDKARDAAIAGLGDRRWYFVRNLITILRELNDPSILKHIRRLCDQTHPKVRQEVIRTFQHFNHPEADRFLIQDMNGSNREFQLNAIQLAEKSRSPEVFKRLLDYLNRGGFAGLDFEIKSTVVRTLAEIRNEEALPALMRLIRSKNLLRPAALNRLKVEVMNSLSNYPADSVWRLFGELSASDHDELANLVQASLKNTQDKP